MAQLQTNHRQKIIETLQLLSSQDEQLAYQQSVPISQVSAELFCFWDDVFWQNDDLLRGLFSVSEWAALMRFNSVFERVLRLLPHHPLPPIDEFVQSPHWLQLSRAAARALHVIGTNFKNAP